jgi:hypothetical protein
LWSSIFHHEAREGHEGSGHILSFGKNPGCRYNFATRVRV